MGFDCRAPNRPTGQGSATSGHDNSSNRTFDPGIAPHPIATLSVMAFWITPILRFTLLVSALFSNAYAAEPLPNLRDIPYPVARSELAALGYAPIRVARRASWMGCPYPDDCRRYPELLQCSGTGIALCDFVFRKRRTGKYVFVTTYGEELRRVHSLSYARRYDLEGWKPAIL